ncbi:MAG TPA: TonB family protein [Terriglobales bacterium]
MVPNPETVDFRTLPEPPSLWRELVRELRERISPPPEPDLHLQSKPIPVKEIWSRPKSLGKRLSSAAIHVAIIGILMLPLWRPVRNVVHHEEVEILAPAIMAPGHTSLPKMRHIASGGAPPTKTVLPPKINPVQAPKPAIAPPLKLMPATSVANLNIPQFGNPGAIPGPPGTSMGNGGAGAGGPGTDPNGGGDCTGAEPCAPGGDVSEPVPVYDPDPEYSEAARKAKFQGVVIVGVIIGADGHVYDPKIVQPLGLGLDEKAIDAVKLWRFEPAKKNGRAVRVAANIQVNFRLY